MKIKRFNRDTNARKALFKGLVASLVEHEKIETTAAKARSIRAMFEKMVTTAKEGTVASRRHIQGELQQRSLVSKLVDDIAPRYKNTKGGYTKLVQVGRRKGDNAPLVRLALTKIKIENTGKSDKPESNVKEKKTSTPIRAEDTIKPVKQAKLASRAKGGKRGDR